MTGNDEASLIMFHSNIILGNKIANISRFKEPIWIFVCKRLCLQTKYFYQELHHKKSYGVAFHGSASWKNTTSFFGKFHCVVC